MSDLFDTPPKYGAPLRTGVITSGGRVRAGLPAGRAGRDVFLAFGSLWRRRWVPVLGFMFGAAIGAWVFLLSGAQYRASAQILLTGHASGQDVTLMQSDPVLAQVAGQLKLYQDNWFNRPYWWQRVLPARMVPVDGENGPQARVLGRMQDMLTIEPMSDAGLVRVWAEYRNPDMTALIVNNVVDAYRTHKMAEVLDENDRLGHWLGRRLEVLRDNVVRAQLSLQQLPGGRDVAALPEAEQAQIEELRREIAVGQRLYEQSVLRYQDMIGRDKADAVQVRVVSRADIPVSSSPYTYLSLILWLGVTGFGLGFAYIVLRVLWAQGFTSVHQLEVMSGYPVFAAIPAARGQADGVHHHITQAPAAVLAESLRSLRVALRLRGAVGHRPRTVAVTSTLPDEGKTSLSVMLATVAAKSGERVCVVDCDLRRPSLHKAFGIGNARGLADYLSDRMGLDDVIHKRDPSGVHLITGKSVPSYSLTLLTSGRMERLVASLREQYDLVILDAPSSLAFADARVLAHMVDQTLYVVGWNSTPRRAVLTSLKNYADLGYDPLALVVNKVEMGSFLRDSAAAVVYSYGEGAQEV